MKGCEIMPSWSDEYKIGVPQIDAQHKALFDAVDALRAACNAGKGRAEIIKTIQFVTDYTVKHFADEEELQKKSGYPKYEEHKQLHKDFMAQVKQIRREIDDNGPTIVLLSKLNMMLSSWLINHVKYVDSEIAQYVNR